MLTAAVASVVLMPAYATQAQAADPVRVLITGDSVTQGYHYDYTWRYRLSQEFARQGVPVDFVGSKHGPFVVPGYASSRYAAPFDSDHAAQVGAQVGSLADGIAAEVTTDQPDVVVLAAGLNDLLHGATPAETAASLRRWIDNARAAKPGVRLVLSPVLAIDRAAYPQQNAQAEQYNELMRAIGVEQGVHVADTTRGWVPNATNSVDGVHLTPTGETLVAQRIAEELHRTGDLPARPLLASRPTIAAKVRWTRSHQPVVRISGRVATVTWDNQKLSSVVLYMKRAGAASIYRTYHGSARVAVTHGQSYTFRLQVTRGTLTGPWGPIRTVRA